MNCPTCSGLKIIQAHFVLRADGRCDPVSTLPCPDCNGTGEVDDRHPQWKAVGEKMRLARLKAGKTLREEAKARGLSPSVLNRMERGTVEPKP